MAFFQIVLVKKQNVEKHRSAYICQGIEIGRKSAIGETTGGQRMVGLEVEGGVERKAKKCEHEIKKSGMGKRKRRENWWIVGKRK